MKVLLALTTLVFIFSTAKIDSSHILNGQHFKSHASRFVQRACFFVVCFCFGIKLGLACSLMFVALFDGVINIMLDRPIFHLGNTAKWDRFFRDQPGIFFFVKFSSTIGFILLFYYA